MADVMVARQGARLVVDGRSVRVLANRTTAHADHQVVRDYPDLWKPLPVDFPAEVGQPEQPGAPAPGVGPARPGAREARDVWDAYAAALGLNAEAVSALSNKGEVVALVDALEAGTVVLADDGQVVAEQAPED